MGKEKRLLHITSDGPPKRHQFVTLRERSAAILQQLPPKRDNESRLENKPGTRRFTQDSQDLPQASLTRKQILNATSNHKGLSPLLEPPLLKPETQAINTTRQSSEGSQKQLTLPSGQTTAEGKPNRTRQTQRKGNRAENSNHSPMVEQHKESLKSNQPGEDHPQTQSKKYDKKLRIGRAAETSLA